MSGKFFSGLLLSLLMTTSAAVAESLEFALSNRHFSATPAELEQQFGGPDAVVAGLLELRHKEHPPLVGVRAAQLLLHYTDRPEVVQALEDDVSSEIYKGLARVVALNIDSVQDAAARQRLARAAIARAGREAKFAPYVKKLSQSTDPEVRRIAGASGG